MKHLLVTNDFPPKVGGIQSYLWELWRRLPADEVCVLTTDHPGAAAFDAAQGFRIERVADSWLVPRPGLVARVNRLAADHGADVVIVDPVGPLGLAGGTLGRVRFDRPMGAILHGAEVTIPARHPLFRRGMRACIGNVDFVVAAGGYPLAEAQRSVGRSLPAILIPPGVDGARFHPLAPAERHEARRRFGLPGDRRVVLGVSRLVPRKGFDVVIDAVASLRETRADVTLAIAGSGRDLPRLERRAARRGVPVHFLGRVDDDDLPALYGCADVFTMLCRDRWFGWEQEGFGIVFLEAAACGVPQVAGRSGGSHEAVHDGVSGLVVGDPRDPAAAARALARLLDHPDERREMGAAGRRRAIEEFDLDALAARLRVGLEAQAARLAAAGSGS